MFNFLQCCGQPLIIISWKTAAHVWVRSGSSLLFYAWLVRRLLKPDEIIFPWRYTSDHKVRRVGERQSMWKDILQSSARVATRELFLVKKLSTLVIFTMNLTVFFFLVTLAPDQENKWESLPSYTYMCLCNEGKFSHMHMYVQICVPVVLGRMRN